jgi:hypothetical protein
MSMTYLSRLRAGKVSPRGGNFGLPLPCHNCRVSNRFTAGGSPPDGTGLRLSNGGTDVLFDVLTLAGSALAETAWEQNLVLHFADGHRISRGISGFDLDELPWTRSWQAEKAFFLQMIDTALGRHGWDRLRYDPPFATASLAAYRSMVAQFTPVPATTPPPGWGDWRAAPRPELLARCPAHDLFQGELGCRLCDPGIQPIG